MFKKIQERTGEIPHRIFPMQFKSLNLGALGPTLAQYLHIYVIHFILGSLLVDLYWNIAKHLQTLVHPSRTLS